VVACSCSCGSCSNSSLRIIIFSNSLTLIFPFLLLLIFHSNPPYLFGKPETTSGRSDIHTTTTHLSPLLSKLRPYPLAGTCLFLVSTLIFSNLSAFLSTRLPTFLLSCATSLCSLFTACLCAHASGWSLRLIIFYASFHLLLFAAIFPAKFRVPHARRSHIVEQIVARAGRDLERSDGDDGCHTVCVKIGLG